MPDIETILPRHLSTELGEALASARVVNIVGPRQAGKTTLVRDIFEAGRFITLDDGAVLEAIESDPGGQLELLIKDLHNTPLIIDEAQRSKKLALAIKRIVDSDRRMGQFILTGSSNVFTTLEVADSLAGRMRTLKLWPLSMAEVKQSAPSPVLDWAISGKPDAGTLPPSEPLKRGDYIDLILRGGYPEIRVLPIRPRSRRYRDYVDAIVDRDVADILRIRKTDALRRLIDQMAARTASELNFAKISELIGIQRPTLEQYMDVLSRLSIISRLGAWTSGEARREIKNAKYHFVDTGIAAALRGLSSASFLPDANPTALGGLLESHVYGELLRSAPHQINDFRFYHWRGERGREVDILVESAERLIAIEVKASTTVASQDFKHLRWFADTGPGAKRQVTQIVFYLGAEVLSFGERNFALPVSMLWANGNPSNDA